MPLVEEIRNLSEAQVKRTIEDWLQYQENSGNLVWMRLNPGDRIVFSGKGKAYKIKGAPTGASDLFALRNGVSYWVEVKDAKGKLSEAQIVFKDKVEAQGGIYIEARGLEDIEGILS